CLEVNVYSAFPCRPGGHLKELHLQLIKAAIKETEDYWFFLCTLVVNWLQTPFQSEGFHT
ncbi:hypothetical protein ILYODFUR_038499, partial [Ilyodon furcidens]